MKIETSKFLKFCRIALIFIFLIVIFVFIFPRPKILIETRCEKIKETPQYCLFNCSVSLNKCGNFNGRIVVTHSGWAAVHDETLNFTCNTSFLLKLPKRDYNYIMRFGVKGAGGFDSKEEIIAC
jgi:hypothetical protein